MTPEETFNKLHREALNSPDVLGFFLSGSRGKGFEHEHSDYDIYFVVRDDTVSSFRETHPFKYAPNTECIVYGLSEFEAYAQPGSDTAWDRYSFAHVTVLVDKTETIQALVDDKGALPQPADAYLAAQLDGYINAVFRGFKSHRKSDALAARLHAHVSLNHLLNLMFGLEGRLAPYYDYLRLELTHYPLSAFPLTSQDLLTKIEIISETASVETQQELFANIESLCRKRGLGYVYEDWGSSYTWLKTFNVA